MPKTRSKQCTEAMHPASTPYQRPLADRALTTGNTHPPAAAAGLGLPLLAKRGWREPSFTDWEGMSDDAIVHFTEDLDKDLERLENEATDDVPLSGVHTPLVETATSGELATRGSEEQLSPTPETQALSNTDQSRIAAPTPGAVVIVQQPAEEPTVGIETTVRVPTPAEVTRDLEPMVEGEGDQVGSFQSGPGSQGQEVPTLSLRFILTRNPDNPIILDDDNIYDSALREREQNQPSGMVQWSSPEYEEEVITNFEKKWEEIQTYWFDMSINHDEAGGAPIQAMLDDFTQCLDEVYDNGSLAEGSAAYLMENWAPIQARAGSCQSSTSSALFLRRVEQFSSLLDDFKSQEPLYDEILAYQERARDDE
ncbi:hypothetical protein CC86DRAFT_435328 [Ophiobolus disseminans]|uniref:Uncharacterized protein n=1 Tax=Ophiobolus disseminans TaxID=1469910 RepID=A0A6A6ZBK3_9PLEO|nr:hypothetical protein CC86DRAFT_435328 [Ophiobolus disseminans]